jgi:hypothetical protein
MPSSLGDLAELDDPLCVFLLSLRFGVRECLAGEGDEEDVE